ncbi:MAG: hemC [Chitinophagaceae bacterium]|nr:hemC [Chitinophagaceae bacterium]
MNRTIRIGTRESQLAVWQAEEVKRLLALNGFASELVYIKSEGDIDLQTPLYQMGVQGVFTRSLDIALLNEQIDIAVHSMKDVPTVLAAGIIQAAVLKRASYKDLVVYKHNDNFLEDFYGPAIIATSSTRRKAQWLHRYPNHSIENLRGNVNTRLQKLSGSEWHGAIFAAAGLERINLRPINSVELNWMLPAPAQGAIMIVCREKDDFAAGATSLLNDANTALCTKLERDFLKELLGGCSTPISALAQFDGDKIKFEGNIVSPDGKMKAEIKKEFNPDKTGEAGKNAAIEILSSGAQEIINDFSR